MGSGSPQVQSFSTASPLEVQLVVSTLGWLCSICRAMWGCAGAGAGAGGEVHNILAGFGV